MSEAAILPLRNRRGYRSPSNPHFYAVVVGGGFDDEGTFFYIPLDVVPELAFMPLQGAESKLNSNREGGGSPTIFVSGATGTVGSHVVQELLDRGTRRRPMI